MKLPSSISKLLENKYVLYLVFFLAIANILGYLAMGKYKAIIMFVLIGYLVRNFNKNMTVVLLVPLVLTTLFASDFVREGLENATKPSDETKPTEEKKPQTPSASPSSPTPDTVGADKTASDVVVDETGAAKQTTPKTPDEKTPQANEKFSNPYDKRASRLDYAATVEDAYGDLNNILGGDGIKNLTADTQKLMEQQLQLANAMKSMTPLLDQAKSLMNGFDMKNFGNIAEMAKQFKASN
jgi:hypothetical protein